MSRERTPAPQNLGQDELRGGPTGSRFQWGDVVVRVGDLPLFRRAPDGSLRQALRVVLESPHPLGPISVGAREGNGNVEEVTENLPAGINRVLLFLPEADSLRRVELRISADRGETFRATVKVLPQRKWSVFLVHHSHLDIGYTDPQDLVLRHHMTYLDSVLDLIGATDSWPAPAMFRWTVEANWPLRYWLANRPTRSVESFVAGVRAGRVDIAALPFTMHTEALSMDELTRQLWFIDELRERYDVRIDSAMQTDVPGATLGLLSALVDADVRNLAVAHNYAGRSVPHLADGKRLTRPFYWTDGAGRKLCVWYTDTPHGVAYMEGNMLGLADDYEVVSDLLPEYLACLAQRTYPYSVPLFGWKPPADDDSEPAPYPFDILHLRVQGAFADNASPSIVPAEIVRRWCSEWVYPELHLSTNREFFDVAEDRLAGSLDEFGGDWTDWWADGIGSAARPLAFNRRAQSTVRSAQTLNLIADKLVSDGAEAAATWPTEVARTYDEMALFDEHTWGAANPWEDALDKMNSGALQWDRKAAFASAALERAERLAAAGLARLEPLWAAPESSLGAVVVLNPTSWTRTDLVTVFLPESRFGDAPQLDIVEPSARQAVPSTVEDQQHAAHRPRGRHLSFIAHDVPPLGFALYELRPGGDGNLVPALPASEPRIGNEHFEVEFDLGEGCIGRIVERNSGRDLVAANAPFGFNQYIYDRYATAPHINHLSSRITAEDLSLLGSRSVAGHAVVTERSATPVWERLTVRLAGRGVRWLETTLTALRGVNRVDITNRLSKVGTDQKESAFFAFPFNAHQAALRYEITGGTSSPTSPHVPGSARHMRAIRHWASVTTDRSTIVWITNEAPLVEFGNLHLPYAPFPATLEPESDNVTTIYSWIHNNIWDTNFPSRQQGEIKFNYAVSSAPAGGDDTLARQTAAAVTMPLVALLVRPSETSTLPAQGSFCEVSRPDVEIVALAPSRRGHDLVALLQSHVAEPAQVDVRFPLMTVARAWKGTHLERHLREVPIAGDAIQLTVGPGELSTISMSLGAQTDG